MQKFFTQSIGYKLPSRECLADILLDKNYLEIKQNVDTFLAIYDLINIVSNENNNQAGDKILNITVLTKDHEFFYTYFKSCSAMNLIAKATAIWMLEKID